MYFALAVLGFPVAVEQHLSAYIPAYRNSLIFQPAASICWSHQSTEKKRLKGIHVQGGTILCVLYFLMARSFLMQYLLDLFKLKGPGLCS